jgi:hypothetical protein
MKDALNSYCQFVGYSSCSVMSTFEAIMLAGFLFVILAAVVNVFNFFMRVFFGPH